MSTSPTEAGQDLTHGNIGKELWSVAWPLMLSIFFYTLYNLVDAYWVSKLSDNAIAAVSISQITLMLMLSLGMGITVGSGVIMAMSIGAKNKPEAERVLGQSFVLSIILAALFTVIALVFRTPFLTWSGASGAILEPALGYYTIVASGSVLMFLLFTVMFAFNAQGDTKSLTKLFALSAGINMVLDPILIFGHLGLPDLGIQGAAIATLISQVAFIIVALRSLMSPKRHIRFYFKNLSFQWESVKKVLKIGFPAALTQMIFPLGLAATTALASAAFAESGAIAFSLGLRVEFFAFLPAIGFGAGGMAMIGQSLGANNIKRAQTVFKKAVKYGFLGAGGLGLLVALLAGPIIGAFTKDPIVTDYAHAYMWTVALLGYGFSAVMMISSSAFQAIGHSWPGLWIMLLKYAGVSLPLGYVLSFVFDFPIVSMWLALLAGNVVAAGVGYSWISWKLKNLQPKEVPVHAPVSV